MSISEQLVGKTSTEKAQLKAAAIYGVLNTAITAAVSKNKSYTFLLLDGRVVKVEAVRLGVLGWTEGVITFTSRTDGGANPIWVKVSVNGDYLNGDGWYGFQNPPIMVLDGTTTEVTNPISGQMFLRSNVKEDLVLAAKTMVAHAVGGEI